MDSGKAADSHPQVDSAGPREIRVDTLLRRISRCHVRLLESWGARAVRGRPSRISLSNSTPAAFVGRPMRFYFPRSKVIAYPDISASFPNLSFISIYPLSFEILSPPSPFSCSVSSLNFRSIRPDLLPSRWGWLSLSLSPSRSLYH